MARAKSLKKVITFPTTTQAIMMEQKAGEQGISGRLIPVPRQISSGCGMAWCCQIEEGERTEALIEKWEIETEGVFELLL
ncbi:MAG: DUF3343 domain-containing protein [Clostridium sp.]|nr:DUF3343 domain-containing protein [Clostridium sp.]